ncbi:MAG TPA: hypothetical protein VE987_21390, partial [Polyangiaceae bacterium]|nr:hypothetical protein [Polyangiaceae bacterium]
MSEVRIFLGALNGHEQGHHRPHGHAHSHGHQHDRGPRAFLRYVRLLPRMWTSAVNRAVVRAL